MQPLRQRRSSPSSASAPAICGPSRSRIRCGPRRAEIRGAARSGLHHRSELHRAGRDVLCTSMGTGPEAGPGYDLALTELVSAGQHRFLVEVGSAAGAQVLAGVPVQDADDATVASARTAAARAAELMGRSMPAGIRHELIAASHDAARWDDVAARCLSCGKLHDGLPDLSPRCGPKRGRNCGETGSRRAPWPATSSCAGWPGGTSRCSPGRPVWLPSSQVTGSSRRAARPAASG